MATTINDLAGLAEHVRAADESPEMIGRRIYKDTNCGAWFVYSPPLNESYGSVLVGTIIEGSSTEPIVSPRRLYFPFNSDEFDKAIKELDEDGAICWEHVNACMPECSGDACGYLAHAGTEEVAVNQPPKETEEDSCEP